MNVTPVDYYASYSTLAICACIETTAAHESVTELA